MKEELNRLRTLVTQLIARLKAEREENARLRSQLALKEAELSRAKGQLNEAKRRIDALFAQFRGSDDSLL